MDDREQRRRVRDERIRREIEGIRDLYRSDPDAFERETQRLRGDVPKPDPGPPNFGVEFASRREEAVVMRRALLEAARGGGARREGRD